MIRLDNIHQQYGAKLILQGINLSIAPGKITGLFGPNGSGKSTLFEIISGITTPTKGSIYIDDIDVTAQSLMTRCHNQLGFLPQASVIIDELTVHDNIMAVLELGTHNPTEQQQRLAELLNQFQLTNVSSQTAHAISGGQRRKTELAMAIANRPKYLLLDEPMTGVDPIAINEIIHYLVKLSHDGIGILITDHQAKTILRFCDEAVILYRGEIMAAGPSQQIQQSKQVIEHYLGQEHPIS